MSDHGASQDLPFKQHTPDEPSFSAWPLNSLKPLNGRPDRGEPAGSQQRLQRKLRQRLTHEEEWHCTPVLRAQLLNELKQYATYKTRTINNAVWITTLSVFYLRRSSWGKLVKKVAMKTRSFTASSGHSPTLSTGDLDDKRCWLTTTKQHRTGLAEVKRSPVEKWRFGENVHKRTNDEL